MHAVKNVQDRETPRSPTWPKLVLITVAALILMMWLCVWCGVVSADWGMWALSSGVVAAAMTVAIWLQTPN